MFSIKSLGFFTLAALLSSTTEAASAENPAPRFSLTTIPAIPSPTASPIPPVDSRTADYLGKLTTASFYAFLLANGGDYQALCDAIVPENLSNIGSGGINGTAIKKEICAGASIVAGFPEFEDVLIKGNQVAIRSLGVAILAVEIAGGFGGAPDLGQLCAEIEPQYINGVFVNYTNTDFGDEIKDYICSAAADAPATPSSGSPSSARSAIPSRLSSRLPSRVPSGGPSGSSPSQATRTSASASANTVVPAGCLYGSRFNVTASFSNAHELFLSIEPDATASQAGVVTRCLERCIGYDVAAGKSGRTCASIFANRGLPETSASTAPLGGDGDPRNWFCAGFDAPLTLEDFFEVDVPGVYENPIAVNRVSEGDFRAY